MKAQLSILVIDDEVSLNEIYSKFLAKIGAVVTFCDHPQKGWHAIDKEEYDLIITDLKMPVISGDEFISITRSSKLNAHTPIILCSGHINKLVITEMARESKIYFLAKPFESASLLELIKKALGVKHIVQNENHECADRWLKTFTRQLSKVTGEVDGTFVTPVKMDQFEVWNFETISLHFFILERVEGKNDQQTLGITLLMKPKSFLKIAGKIQGTDYKEIESETMDVWKDLLGSIQQLSGRVTFSKVLSQEFISRPEINSSYFKFSTKMGEILVYLN